MKNKLTGFNCRSIAKGRDRKSMPLNQSEILKKCAKRVGGTPSLATLTGYSESTIRNWIKARNPATFCGVIDCCTAARLNIEFSIESL